jgi:hypothetical protein
MVVSSQPDLKLTFSPHIHRLTQPYWTCGGGDERATVDRHPTMSGETTWLRSEDLDKRRYCPFTLWGVDWSLACEERGNS